MGAAAREHRAMKGTQLGVRVTKEITDRVDALVRAIPGTSRGGIVRAALEEGLKNLEGKYLRKK